jgi:8-oxo-dGTP diphosphatase
MTRYVVGIAFGPGKRVALIRKNRPDWQAGLLNGVGGHIEDFDEGAVNGAFAAMQREFREETSVDQTIWRLFLEVTTPKSHVYFFTTRLTDEQFKSLKTTTDESIVSRFSDALNWKECLPNLRWIIPLATMAHCLDGVVQVQELSEERAV